MYTAINNNVPPVQVIKPTLLWEDDYTRRATANYTSRLSSLKRSKYLAIGLKRLKNETVTLIMEVLIGKMATSARKTQTPPPKKASGFAVVKFPACI